MFEKLMPTRSKSEPPIRVADLDKISIRKSIFTLHGKDHVITPPDIQNWFLLIEANNELWALKDQDVVTPDELVEKYFNLMSKVCDSITKDDIRKATQMQIAGLWQLVLDMMNGSDQKKSLVSIALQGMTKRDINNLIQVLSQYSSTLPDSLQSLQKSSGGPLT